MARNRMIKPEFFSDEKVSKLSLGARLLFIGIWNFADDCGVYHNNPRKILGDIYPNDLTITPRQVKNWVDSLVKNGFVLEIVYNSTAFLKVKNWEKHQIVANPSKKQWIPDENLQTLISLSLETNKKFLIKDKDKGKVKDKEKEVSPDGDFIDKLINSFKAQYLIIKEIEYKGVPGADRKAMGQLLGFYKKQKPDVTSDETLSDFENIFKHVLSFNFKNDFLNAVTITKLNQKWDEYRQSIKEPKYNGKGFDPELSAIRLKAAFAK